MTSWRGSSEFSSLEDGELEILCNEQKNTSTPVSVCAELKRQQHRCMLLTLKLDLPMLL